MSVVFPVYGDFSAERLLLSIEAMRAQKDVEPEVVVVERGTTSRLQGKLDPSVIYRFQPYTPSKEFGDFNQGEVRNDAIAASSGEFIYTNDGDVMFMDEHFLARSREILEQNHDMALYRPPMRRLPLDNFEEFKRRADAKSIREAIASLNLHTNEFLATTDDEPRNVRVAVSNSEGDLRVRTTSEEDFARYTADASLKDNEHVIWSENVHYGGNFLRRWQFERVGGYCERYINWGCEDTDFQWKLRNTFNLQHFPKIGKFTVLHLDHEKRYLIPAMVKRNEELFERRRKDGVYLAIKEDRNQKERRGSFHS
ncbi:MAG: glycosyltransferase [Deltaproteobacteria bacterium]|nr:glycosyltransferase [Deltaproteobacteria bacterium]